MLAASMLLLMACSDYAGDSPTAPTPPGPSPSEQITLQLQPAQVQLDVGDTRSLKADLRDSEGNPAAGFTVTWSSPDPPVAEVDAEGVVLGNGADSVYVTAEAVRHSDGTVLWDSALVAVRGDMEPVRELEVDPESIELSAGSAQAVRATPKDGKGKSQENRPIEWSSSNEDVATVDDSGMVKAMGTGDATISVRSGGHQRDLPVKVQSSPGTSVASVTVTPTSDTLAPGERVTLEATVEDSAGEVLDRPVQWSSSNATFASVDDRGVVAAAAEGEATITATSGGESGSATIVVSEDGESTGDDEEPAAPATIEIEPSSAALETDESVTLDVTVRDSAGNVLDRKVEWSSSDASVASVDGGTVSGEAAGEATVTAVSGDVEGTASVTVSEEEPAAVAGVEVEPSSLALEPGQTATLEATVTDADGNVLDREVEWSSSDASVASVDGGTVSGESAGEATITATSEGESGSATVTVAAEEETSGASSGTSGSPTLGLGGGANEPSGYQKILEWDMGHELPPMYTNSTGGCDLVTGLDGSAVADSRDDTWQEAGLTTDSDAPLSGPEVYFQVYPAGKVGESAREKLWAWATPSTDPCDIINASPEQYRKVYLREVRKIWTDRSDGTVETFQSGAGLKFSYLQGDIKGPRPEGFRLTLGVTGINSSAPAYMSSFPLKVRNLWFDVDGNSHTEVRSSTDDVIRVGVWHEVEWLVEVNTIAADGSANRDGRIRGWVDGALVIDWQGVRMRSGYDDKTASLIQNYTQPTTWSGGPTDVHTHDKGFHVDHVYVSGAH